MADHESIDINGSRYKNKKENIWLVGKLMMKNTVIDAKCENFQ